METQVSPANEFRTVSLSLLRESTTNPRKNFATAGLEELAETIRTQGVLSPLLVRPVGEEGFEVVFGARRFRAAKIAEQETVPVRIQVMTDAEVLEAQLVENLQRRDVHPMEEAQGFHGLLTMEEPKYSVEQIAAKMGKSPAYITTRLKLIDLTEPVVKAFYAEEIGVGHALLLAKLQPEQQELALKACFRDDWNGTGKKARMLLPMRSLQFWIDHNILLLLKEAPFDRRDAELLRSAGSCADCPKRTGHNKLLFADFGKQDCCTDPACFTAKIDAHVARQIAERPKLVQISTSFGPSGDTATALPRGKYIEIRTEKPSEKEQASRPEYKTCKHTTEAIVTEGEDRGFLRKVCSDPACVIHHARPKPKRKEAERAEQQKERKQQAIADTIAIRTLSAIGEAVPVRLLKRDLQFAVLQIARSLEVWRILTIARQHGVRAKKDGDSIENLFTAFIRQADEATLSRVLIECCIVLAASKKPDILAEAAALYKVDTTALAKKVRHEINQRSQSKNAA